VVDATPLLAEIVRGQRQQNRWLGLIVILLAALLASPYL
jgi:hypothetical protein